MITESEWETYIIDRLGDHGWEHLPGPDIVPGQADGRMEWDSLVLKSRAAQALRSLNPGVPPRYLDEALGEILAATSADPVAENFRFHGYLTHGYRGSPISMLTAPNRIRRSASSATVPKTTPTSPSTR